MLVRGGTRLQLGFAQLALFLLDLLKRSIWLFLASRNTIKSKQWCRPSRFPSYGGKPELRCTPQAAAPPAKDYPA